MTSALTQGRAADGVYIGIVGVSPGTDAGAMMTQMPSLTILERTVNGQPGLVAQQDGVTVTVFAFGVAGDRIKHIWAVRNPEKLRPWTTG